MAGPNLTSAEMSNARSLFFSGEDPPIGFGHFLPEPHRVAYVSGIGVQTATQEVFSFLAVAGRTYGFMSSSALDPRDLRIADQGGTIVLNNDESDDFIDMSLGGLSANKYAVGSCY